MQIREWLNEAAARLSRAGRDSPRLSAECILAHALGLSRHEILIHPEDGVSSDKEKELALFLSMRLDGVPLAYITGEKEFYGIPLKVTRDTLIPRPDTECLVEQVIDDFGQRNFLFADLGTGSGAIGIAVASNCGKARGLLVDREQGAIACAMKNVRNLGLEERLACIAGSFENLPIGDAKLDAVLSNPPYISIRERDSVMDEVLLHEPQTALFAGEDGLSAILQVIETAVRVLKRGGALYVEHGAFQGPHVRKLMAERFFSVKTKKDLAGRERMSYCFFR